MSQHQATYKSIFKATSIFGGVQVFNILITIIRGKVLAILIGTAGMGLNGLVMSGLNLIKSLTSLGIAESAVRDISMAHATGDQDRIATTYAVFKRMIWLTALLGVGVTIASSYFLSQMAFGNGAYMFWYVALSSTFVFGALTGGIYTLLRGIRQVGKLAQATMMGSAVGLLVALPIFYVYKMDGVIPSIIATAFATYLVSLLYTRQVHIPHVKVSWRDTWTLGKPMVMLGINLSASTLLASGVAYVLNAYIVQAGNLSDLGIYNAGQTIVTSYVGMVFTAMGTDYFPRLSGVIHDEKSWKTLVNQQADLVLLILAAVLVVMVATAPLMIRILLSEEFMAAKSFIVICVLSIPLKGLVWTQGFVMMAKGDNRMFLTTETVSNLWMLGLNLLFYTYFQLEGLGVAQIVSYVLSQILMIYVLRKRYQFGFSTEVYAIFGCSMLSLLAAFAIDRYAEGWLYLALHVLNTAGILIYVGTQLERRMQLISTFRNKFFPK